NIMSEIKKYIDKLSSADPTIQWQVVKKQRDGFSIEYKKGIKRVTGNNCRSCLWGVLHIKNGGEAGTYRPEFAVRGVNVCESLLRHTPEQIETLLDRMALWRMNRLIVHVAYGYQKYGELIEKLCQQRGI